MCKADQTHHILYHIEFLEVEGGIDLRERINGLIDAGLVLNLTGSEDSGWTVHLVSQDEPPSKGILLIYAMNMERHIL